MNYIYRVECLKLANISDLVLWAGPPRAWISIFPFIPELI
jgi:hypothetical protein